MQLGADFGSDDDLTDEEFHAQLEMFRLEEERRTREKVSPALEIFREPMRIKLARGGRAAGAKSWSIVSLNVQDAHRMPLRIAFLREVQASLEESVYRLVKDTVERLGYEGWIFTREYISSPAGAYMIFRGLNDLRSARQMKSLEGYDRFILEEASSISKESINVLLPTLRKPGSELWAIYNQETEYDPITSILWNSSREDMVKVELRPGALDNPWWTPELQHEMETQFKDDPDEAEHIWNGLPRKQGQRSVMSRIAIRAAMDRKLEEGSVEEIGVDVARFGDDKTTFFRRKGMKIVEWREVAKMDTQETARIAWDMAGRNPSIPIKVDDSGVGGGTVDKLKDLGAKVIPVNFGGEPQDKELYTSVADEMWFTFPIDQVQIPDDIQLMEELAGRQYKYTSKDQRKVEPKDEFKKRIGRSPDKADGLLLCFYSPKEATFAFAF
jgi:phage terminase large subunit